MSCTCAYKIHELHMCLQDTWAAHVPTRYMSCVHVPTRYMSCTCAYKIHELHMCLQDTWAVYMCLQYTWAVYMCLQDTWAAHVPTRYMSCVHVPTRYMSCTCAYKIHELHMCLQDTWATHVPTRYMSCTCAYKIDQEATGVYVYLCNSTAFRCVVTVREATLCTYVVEMKSKGVSVVCLLHYLLWSGYRPYWID